MIAPQLNQTIDETRASYSSRVRMLWSVLVVLIAAFGVLHESQAQSIRAYVSVDSVRVGDRFMFTLVAEHAENQQPLFPSPQDGEEIFGDLTVLEQQGRGTEQRARNNVPILVDSLVYEVTTFALDTAFVPSIPVFFAADGDTTFFASRPIELPVISMVTPDAATIRDLKPIFEFPRNIWPWIIGLLIAAALIAGLVYYLSNKGALQEEVVIRAPTPQLPPYEEALKKLRGLEKNANLNDAYKIKPYYVELTGILRYYLGRRLDINAMESTSKELMDDVNRLAHTTNLPNEAAYLLRRILHVSDLVKFADMHPRPEVGHQALVETRKVLDVVEKSFKPVVVPTESPAVETVYEEKVEQVQDE